jgi:hypothetical protein
VDAALGVQDDGGGDYGAGQGAPARFVDAGDAPGGTGADLD